MLFCKVLPRNNGKACKDLKLGYGLVKSAF